MSAVQRHIFIGVAAGIGLIALFLGLMTLLESFAYAVKQAGILKFWIAGLATGFGIQAGLYSFIRHTLHQRRAAATGAVATSGGVSTGSMIACCAHHLSEILPLLGLSGLSLFLARYQSVFLMAGVMSNIVGIAIMMETIQRHNLCSWIGRIRLDLGWVKRGSIGLAAVVVAVYFVFTMSQF